jgi:hypothetical protein
MSHHEAIACLGLPLFVMPSLSRELSTLERAPDSQHRRWADASGTLRESNLYEANLSGVYEV